MPPVEIVDLRTAPRSADRERGPLVRGAGRGGHTVLARGEQAILLLNRRGYAAFVQCPECGLVPECPDCSIALTLHRVPPGLRCHYCGKHFPVAVNAPAAVMRCSERMASGPQQLEELVAARFPKARLARMDLDTTSRGSAITAFSTGSRRERWTSSWAPR
jgi:primosomal protein N' (replication factor Y)